MSFARAPARSVTVGLGFVALGALLPLLDGCAPAVVAVGAAEVAIVAGDPRTTGTQLDDQSIEFKVSSEAGTRYGNDVHLNVTSYNGVVLLTGEVPSTRHPGRDHASSRKRRTRCGSCTTRWWSRP